MPGLSQIGLSKSEVRKAGQEARSFLGDNPREWRTMGDDVQKVLIKEYLDHLRTTENSGIADSLASQTESLREFLRVQTKAQRARSGMYFPSPENLAQIFAAKQVEAEPSPNHTDETQKLV